VAAPRERGADARGQRSSAFFSLHEARSSPASSRSTAPSWSASFELRPRRGRGSLRSRAVTRGSTRTCRPSTTGLSARPRRLRATPAHRRSWSRDGGAAAAAARYGQAGALRMAMVSARS
jgi:hypothetical protein